MPGCGERSTGSSTPAKHGGYVGRAAILYEDAKLACRRQLAKGTSHEALTTLMNRLQRRLNPSNATQITAIGVGCLIGLGAEGPVSGYTAPLYSTAGAP